MRILRWSTTHRVWLTAAPANGVSDAALGAWTRLANYASDKETTVADLAAEVGAGRLSAEQPLGEGVIQNCQDWVDRQWLTACGTDRTGVGQAVAAGLATWKGKDLVVVGIDLWGMVKVKRLRVRNTSGRAKNSKVAAAQSGPRLVPPSGSKEGA